MADPRIPLKNPYVAVVLAYLVPGAGHLYQGRVFKGLLYLLCILGTYLFGLAMSEWQAVYWRMDGRRKNIAFFAQAGVGMFAIPAYVQARRFNRQANFEPEFDQPISSEYSGLFRRADDPPVPVEGRIELHAEMGDFGREIRGTFVGQTVPDNGPSRKIELQLASPVDIGPTVGPGQGRRLDTEVVERTNGRERRVGWLAGEIPRAFFNHFAVPLHDDDLDQLNARLPKQFELAKIFTWIAGLLNILAVWDALEGPAYGYGDEEEEGKSPEDKEGESIGTQSKPQADGADQPTEKPAV